MTADHWRGRDKSDATHSDHSGSNCRHYFADCPSSTWTRLSDTRFEPRSRLPKICFTYGVQSDKLDRITTLLH
jgi:hypothetical protein